MGLRHCRVVKRNDEMLDTNVGCVILRLAWLLLGLLHRSRHEIRLGIRYSIAPFDTSYQISRTDCVAKWENCGRCAFCEISKGLMGFHSIEYQMARALSGDVMGPIEYPWIPRDLMRCHNQGRLLTPQRFAERNQASVSQHEYIVFYNLGEPKMCNLQQTADTLRCGRPGDDQSVAIGTHSWCAPRYTEGAPRMVGCSLPVKKR